MHMFASFSSIVEPLRPSSQKTYNPISAQATRAVAASCDPGFEPAGHSPELQLQGTSTQQPQRPAASTSSLRVLVAPRAPRAFRGSVPASENVFIYIYMYTPARNYVWHTYIYSGCSCIHAHPRARIRINVFEYMLSLYIMKSVLRYSKIHVLLCV